MARYDEGVPISHIRIPNFRIWVHLYNLPLGYFTREMLRKVASAVGVFIDVSSMPEDQPSEVTKAFFAKVLVRMDINSPHMPSFLVRLQHRKPFRVYVR